jgi:aspartokinase-like uncharacterized kinase
MTLPIRVLKLGGSLLELPDLAWRLTSWLERQPPAAQLLVPGGGKLVDSLAQLDQIHGIGQEASHWLCIRAMSIHAELLSHLLPRAILCRYLVQAFALAAEGRLVIVDPWHFTREDDARLPGAQLPATWEVSSDSIAARLARATQAAELVLFKSRLPDDAWTTVELAAEAGYVDPWFPRAAARLPVVRCVNLQHDPPTECRWEWLPEADEVSPDEVWA